MADYLFEFVAHIDERKRPEGFPREVFIREQYQGLETDEQVKDFYNQRVKTMLVNPGLIVFLNEAEVIQTSLTFDQRVFIPWHMITHFHGRAKLMTTPSIATPLESIVPVAPEPSPSGGKELVN